jgi:phospholipid/cholesterol/gamma-HCH transport system ATP-binding protein
MMLIDKGNIEAYGTPEEMRHSTHPRVRQFLDRVPEPEISQELDYLQMLTEGNTGTGRMAGWRRGA